MNRVVVVCTDFENKTVVGLNYRFDILADDDAIEVYEKE